jgi:hypothetical protein
MLPTAGTANTMHSAIQMPYIKPYDLMYILQNII